MTWKQTIEAYEMLDSAAVTGQQVVGVLQQRGLGTAQTATVEGERGETDFVCVTVTGTEGKTSGGPASTLGIVGWLGGVGARPAAVGLVSDADGAITALA